MAPVYDQILKTLIEEVRGQKSEVSSTPNVDAEIADLDELLADSFLSSYLLGLHHARDAAKLTSDLRPLTSVSFQDPPANAGGSDKTLRVSFNVPPKEAIDYFKATKTVPKKQFNKLSREARAASFTVGGVYKDDVLKGFKDELRISLETGRTQAQTIKRFHDILSGAGHRQLGEFHLETVFRTNMQRSYGVGRRSGLEEVKDDLPFWTRHAVMDDRTRPKHAALNGVTLPADHEFWDTHFCPDDFNCRCLVTAAVDMPDGYDPKNPSGLTDGYGQPLVNVSYDNRGIPAKAEYGTTLHDLGVGSFAGIPRGATLLSAIEAGVKRK